MKKKILIVDDEPDMLSTCKAILSDNESSVATMHGSIRALELLNDEYFDLLVTDIKMPGLNGVELMKKAMSSNPNLLTILMTAFPDVDSALEALKLGALDYLIKPFHPDELRIKVHRALEERRIKEENHRLLRHIRKHHNSADIIGQSSALLNVLNMADKVASTNADVLILGESGTGKELIARRIHSMSNRKGHFVPVDCGAIPENLLENELFGHEKGAYTDASASTPGLLEFAHLGSFFMDEVCELPLSLQSKLLRTLQERQFRRVGGKETMNVDIHVIAATNKDILNEIKESRFREDLYYRLNVVTIHVPPLRERREDIPLLVRHYLPLLCLEMGKQILDLDEEVNEILIHYPWPGNIRELQNVIKKMIVQCEDDTIRPHDVPQCVKDNPGMTEDINSTFPTARKKFIQSFEKDYFDSLLQKHNGNSRASAESAGLPLSNFYWYLKKYNIKPQSFQK